ncbi:MAG: NGG1p interacting factor NIF3 [Actinomycetota bacterium]
MKLREIYDLAVRMGIDNDPRGKEVVLQQLKRAKGEYERLSEEEKKDYDIEKFTNPFSDTRILNGDPETEVGMVLAGIDMEVGEALLADRLREKGTPIDLIISHHPEAKALAALSEVMPMQADIWYKYGVPINVGDALITDRMKEIQRAFLPINHTRPVDAARLLNMPFLCAHTATDNLVTTYLQKIFDEKPPATVRDILDTLKKIPEYQRATKESVGPTVIVGDPSKRPGKVMVDMTGGTGGPKEIIQKLGDAGVGTLVGMHMSEDARKEAEKHHMNIVIAGHTSSDGLGMNLFLDELEKKGVKVLACSGLARVKRI